MELTTTTFLLIIAGYVLGGVVSLVLAATGFGGSNRIVNGLIGLACLGYAGYLFFTPSETVWIFWYAMLIPFLALFQAIKGAVARPRMA